MGSEKKNGFDAISEFIDKNGSPESSNLASVDIGPNAFFEIGLPFNNQENTPPGEEVAPVTINSDVDINLDELIPGKSSKDAKARTPKLKTKPASTDNTSGDNLDNTDFTQEEEEEVDEEKVIDVAEKVDEDYSTWSDFSLIALEQVKKGDWDLDESEIPKDLDAVTLMEMYDAQKKASIEKVQQEVIEQAGEYAKYIKYLMDGGSSEVVSDMIDLEKLITLDPEDEENQKTILTAVLELKGMEEDVIQDTIEAILDKGKGKQKTKEAIEQLASYKDNVFQSKAKEREDQIKAQKAQYDNYVNSFTKTVRAGKLGSVVIDKNKQEQIINAMFKPTEVMEVINPKTGAKEKTRVTKSTLLFREVNENPEKLAALTLWLLEGGNFEGIKEQVKSEKDDSLRQILKGRRTAVVNNTKQSNGKPNAFEVIANRVNQQEYNRY